MGIICGLGAATFAPIPTAFAEGSDQGSIVTCNLGYPGGGVAEGIEAPFRASASVESIQRKPTAAGSSSFFPPRDHAQILCGGGYTGAVIAGRVVSQHASDRMIERGFDKVMVESILNYGRRLKDTVNRSFVYSQEGGSGRSRMVAVDYSEKTIKTVMIGNPPTTIGRMRALPY